MDDLKKVIKTLVKEVLQEKLRGGFDINKFKSLQTPGDMIQYAQQSLGKSIGLGSSRIVFTLSSGKVLKITRTGTDLGVETGRAQNQAEVDVWTNPLTKPVVAKVYDYDPKFNWIISEISRPFSLKHSTRREQTIGLDEDTFNKLLQYSLKGKIQSFDQAYRQLTQKHLDTLKDIEKEEKTLKARQDLLDRGYNDADGVPRLVKQQRIHGEEMNLGWQRHEVEKILNNFKSINIAKLKPLIDGLIAMRDQMGLDIDDILRMDHYGVTGDGRIIVIDYGWNEEIGKTFYNWSPPPESDF